MYKGIRIKIKLISRLITLENTITPKLSEYSEYQMAFIRNSQNFTSAQADVVSTISKAFRYDDEYVRPNNVTVHTTSNFRTKPCLKGPNCTYIDQKTGEDKCQFANDPSKLVPIKCMYNERCRNERCTRLHTGQTMDEYILNNQFTWPEKKETVTQEMSLASKYDSNSFIIKIDDTTDEESDDEENRAIDRVCKASSAEQFNIININDEKKENLIVEQLQTLSIENEKKEIVQHKPDEMTSILCLSPPHTLIAMRAQNAIREIEEQTLAEISREMEEICDEIEIIQHQQEFIKECEDRDSDPEIEEFIERIEAFMIYQNAQSRAIHECQYADFAYNYARSILKGLEVC